MTNEPVRWVDGGTDAEREMLQLLGSERPSEELSARMRAVVVGPVLATLASASATGGAGAALGEVGVAANGAVRGTSATGAATTGGGFGAGAIALGALIVTGVIGLGVYLASLPDEPAATPTSEAVSVPAARGAEATAQDAAPGALPPEETTRSSEPTAPVEQPIIAEPTVRSGSGALRAMAAHRPVAEATDTSSLSRELAILEQARRALERGERDAAAALLATYRAQYPEGQLKSEANVLEQRARSTH